MKRNGAAAKEKKNPNSLSNTLNMPRTYNCELIVRTHPCVQNAFTRIGIGSMRIKTGQDEGCLATCHSGRQHEREKYPVAQRYPNYFFVADAIFPFFFFFLRNGAIHEFIPNLYIYIYIYVSAK